jgi:hypothetical protein
MTYAEFLRLPECSRIRIMRRVLKASHNIEDKKLPIQNRDVEAINHCLRWLGADMMVKSWEKRILSKQCISTQQSRPLKPLPTL